MLGEIRQQAAESSEYDHCSLSEIQALTNLGSRLFQTVLTFENYDSGNSAAGVLGDEKNGLKGVLIKDENFDDVAPVAYVDEEGQLTLKLLFDVRKYRMEEMERILSLFELTVCQMVNDPNESLLSLPVLDEANEKAVIALSKSEDLYYDKNATWLSVFRESVKKYPENTAVVDEEGSLIISRKISADGKSVARVNGRTVVLSVLRTLASFLIDIRAAMKSPIFI